MAEELPDTIVDELARGRSSEEVPSASKVKMPSTSENGSVVLFLFLFFKFIGLLLVNTMI